VVLEEGMGKRGPPPRKGAPTTIRFEPELRERLETAAAAAGRSISEEVAACVELSLYPERQFGNVETYALCRVIAEALRDVEQETGRAWFAHPWSFEHGKQAVAELLRFFQPIGEPAVPSDAPLLVRLRESGLSAEVVDQARSQLERLVIGVRKARLNVFLAEGSLANPEGHKAEAFRDIAPTIAALLSAAGMTGEAQQELLLNDGPEQTVTVKL
jgi:hypothetical protein